MDDELVAYTLSLVLDDLRVCKGITVEVNNRLGRKGPQDGEFWRTYTAVANELLDAARSKNTT